MSKETDERLSLLAELIYLRELLAEIKEETNGERRNEKIFKTIKYT